MMFIALLAEYRPSHHVGSTAAYASHADARVENPRSSQALSISHTKAYGDPRSSDGLYGQSPDDFEATNAAVMGRRQGEPTSPARAVGPIAGSGCWLNVAYVSGLSIAPAACTNRRISPASVIGSNGLVRIPMAPRSANCKISQSLAWAVKKMTRSLGPGRAAICSSMVGPSISGIMTSSRTTSGFHTPEARISRPSTARPTARTSMSLSSRRARVTTEMRSGSSSTYRTFNGNRPPLSCQVAHHPNVARA